MCGWFHHSFSREMEYRKAQSNGHYLLTEVVPLRYKPSDLLVPLPLLYSRVTGGYLFNL